MVKFGLQSLYSGISFFSLTINKFAKLTTYLFGFFSAAKLGRNRLILGAYCVHTIDFCTRNHRLYSEHSVSQRQITNIAELKSMARVY